jgi:mRNA-degrading endonuclease toxin of MazEF toxin-antitoxin module
MEGRFQQRPCVYWCGKYQNCPLHIRLPEKCALTGVVMAVQIKSIDYTARYVQFIGKASREIIDEVMAMVDACIFDDGE